ncbi:isocitrate/isopropylmalate dehydrogenase family protein [Fusibacter paucivorans]|uniref:Isocitrate/isopropylmalate dehydrogenase family protein n=1 Tax=Fusibacter paucivorans TaxID=76009 RepID=A0ABS5PQL7_9FIRM|nr:isocitrate/isopropylmalate dehydrogenase family protein [Fusibacter paucivorans]MBS7527197.1 isocitrate/isopropylmalate dehydrogenase family protein [Fusibacter paucivorans]
MYQITLIPGDGIGPEVTASAKALIEAALEKHQSPKIAWDIQNAGQTAETILPDVLLNSLEKNKIALKGPITTPIGKGFKSINVQLRQKYGLYANVRPVKKIIEGRYDENIDFVIFRENTEGLYAGVERVDSPDRIIAEKITTRQASERIGRAAFDYAHKLGLNKVTVVHKANILKQCDGLFLESVTKVSKDYPDIDLEAVIVDNMAMQLVMTPSKYQVIVTTNLYGDILSDLSAGLVGGLGLVPGANLNDDMAVFEPVHGSAPDIAGQDLANPTACILSGVMLLEHLGEIEAAHSLYQAVVDTLNTPSKRTKDLGGTLGTKAYTEAILESLGSL